MSTVIELPGTQGLWQRSASIIGVKWALAQVLGHAGPHSSTTKAFSSLGTCCRGTQTCPVNWRSSDLAVHNLRFWWWWNEAHNEQATALIMIINKGKSCTTLLPPMTSYSTIFIVSVTIQIIIFSWWQFFYLSLICYTENGWLFLENHWEVCPLLQLRNAH